MELKRWHCLLLGLVRLMWLLTSIAVLRTTSGTEALAHRSDWGSIWRCCLVLVFQGKEAGSRT
jgi:hypothetical protein